MLYKKHKIKIGVINLIRIRLNNNNDVCNLCTYGPGRSCTIMDICSTIFTPITAEKYDYICYTKER